MVDCKEQEACDLIKKGIKAEIIYVQENNWTQKYDLICDRAYIRTNAKAGVLVMNTIFCFFLLALCDFFGRLNILKICSVFVATGMVLAMAVPFFSVKIFGIGLTAGAESTFIALFAILINESSTKETKLRSLVLTVGFFSFALGCVAFNAFAFISQNSDLMLKLIAVSIICTAAPGFFIYYETPHFLYRKGRISELTHSLLSISQTNLAKLESGEKLKQVAFFEDELISEFGFGNSESSKAFFKANNIRLVMTKKQGITETTSIWKIFRNWTLFYNLIALIAVGAVLYTVYYGMSISIDKLGFEDLRVNGILVGVTQSFGYISVAPFTHRMKRKKWTLLFQTMILGITIGLAVLSKEPQTELVKQLQAILAALLMPTVISAMFPLFYIYITEVFPSEVRGTANACVLFLARLVGSFAPFFEALSEHFNMHILVGCSLLVFVSLPLGLGMKETLVSKKSE